MFHKAFPDTGCSDILFKNLLQAGRIKANLNVKTGQVSDLVKYLLTFQGTEGWGYFDADFDDETEKCTRLFYMSSGQIAAFRRFGQFVVMDATCNTNRFDMPLVLLVGVDDCFRNVLLGMALISVEDTASCQWVLQNVTNDRSATRISYIHIAYTRRILGIPYT